MKTSGSVVLSTALFVSLAAHVTVAWGLWDTWLTTGPAAAKKKVATRLNFKRRVPPPPAPVKPPKPKPKPKPKVKPPEPKAGPPPKPKPKPEPEIAQVPETPPEPEPVEERVVSAPPMVEEPYPRADFLEQEKLRYLALVMSRIEQRKYYPAAARRRRIEGAAKITLTVSSGGNVDNIKVEGPSILCRAAEEAVRKSAPLPDPPDIIPTPLTIVCVMEFELR